MKELSMYNEALADFKWLQHSIYARIEFPTTYHILLSLEERLEGAIENGLKEEVARLRFCINGFFKWVNSDEF